MRLDDADRTCVAYIYVESCSGIPKLNGTAFFVSVPLNEELDFGYLVTASHVIDSTYNAGRRVYVKANCLEGGSQLVEVPESEWIRDPDSDTAVMPWNYGGSHKFNMRAIPVNMFLTNVLSDKLPQSCVRLGDEVAIVSLCSTFPGEKRVEPIVRQGNVALIPKDRVSVKTGGVRISLPAVLIEARSFGGISGAPVFVASSPPRLPDLIGRSAERVGLLGFVSGHFDEQQNVTMSGDDAPSGKANVNSGIAYVVPADSIRVLLDRPELAEPRHQAALKHDQNKPTGTPDAVADDEDDDPIIPAKRIYDETIRRSEESES